MTAPLRPRRAAARRRTGFSLAEILVAITIVAFLTAMLVPTIYGRLQSARADAIIGELQGLQNGLMRFYTDVGRYPARLDMLNTLKSSDGDSCGLVAIPDLNIARFRGPYVNRSIVMANFPIVTKFAIATGDSIDSVLARLNITTATGTQRVLQISVYGPEQAVADDIDRKVDGTVDATHGIIFYSSAGKIVKWTMPIKSAAC